MDGSRAIVGGREPPNAVVASVVESFGLGALRIALTLCAAAALVDAALTITAGTTPRRVVFGLALTAAWGTAAICYRGAARVLRRRGAISVVAALLMVAIGLDGAWENP